MTDPELTREIRVGGTPLRIWEWNPAGRDLVLLVHGHLDFGRGWQLAVGPLLASGFRIVAPDLRGHGGSGWVPDGTSYCIWDMVSDLAEIIRDSGAGQVFMAGHSLGALVALAFAGAMPRRIRRLALLEPIAPPMLGGPALMEALSAHLVRDDLVRRRGRVRYRGKPEITQVMRRADPRLDEQTAAFLAEHGTRAVEGGLVFHYDPRLLVLSPLFFGGVDARGLLRDAPVPVLLLEAADLEAMNPRYGALKLPPGLPRGWQVMRVEQAGHALHRHRPAEVGLSIARFFREQEEPGDHLRHQPLPDE